MGNDTHPASMQTSAGNQTPAEPQLLSPQPLLPPYAALAGAAALIIGAIAFYSLSATKEHGNNHSDDVTGNAVFAVPADKAHGIFTVLPSNFQQSPGGVLVQLKMPEAEKQRVAEKLTDGSVRLAAVTVWDTMEEDGDMVELNAAGFSQRVTIMHKPVTFFLPLNPGGSVIVKAVHDGGGGVTLGVSTITGKLALPILAVGQSVEIPAL
jgi:hypothetical protein